MNYCYATRLSACTVPLNCECAHANPYRNVACVLHIYLLPCCTYCAYTLHTCCTRNTSILHVCCIHKNWLSATRMPHTCTLTYYFWFDVPFPRFSCHYCTVSRSLHSLTNKYEVQFLAKLFAKIWRS